MCRDLEREILPMCRFFGVALVPWGVLRGGKFQSQADLERKEKEGEGLRGAFAPGEGKNELSEDGKETGVTEVALAYILHKAAQWGVYNVFPVVGGRRVEQLEANIRALGIKLTVEQVKYLESVKPFEIGFPHDFIGGDPNVVGEITNRFGNNGYLTFPGATPGGKNIVTSWAKTTGE